MLFNFKHLVKLTGQLIKKCEFANGFQVGKLLAASRCDFCMKNQAQNFHTSTPRNKRNKELEYRRAAKSDVKSEAKIFEASDSEVALKRKQNFFPTVDLPNTLFGDVAYKNLPVIKIKATRNNTLLTLLDQGFVKISRSCGTEGFKNARKGTNIAAQTTGTAMAQRAVKRGYTHVRVLLRGLGSGRLSSVKGLTLGGLNVVSISDCTVDVVSLRPRKQRRL